MRTEADIYGHYELKLSSAVISLDVNADHSFSEQIAYTNGDKQNQVGNWRWTNYQICFKALLEPKDLLKGLFQDTQNQPKAIGGAYEIDDCLPASWEWGKTILEIDPDNPENLVKTRGPKKQP